MKHISLTATLSFSILLMVIASAAFADAPMPPMMVITQKADPAHASVFNSKANKDASLRAEIVKEGSDMAFTMWMMRDHPYLFAASCTKLAHTIYQHCKHTQAMSEFEALANKRADLKSAVQAEGYDVAFVDWLLSAHPDIYKEHMKDINKGKM